ncbi:MAG: tetratricopeptide repeat protein [Clostridia bacterium]|nr:tetratricopeptide repeat protein [Clostridia bacterium]
MPDNKKNEESVFPASQIINSRQLVELMKESNRNNVRFCFILGSGASISSGIPTGRALEKTWMKCLMGEEDDGASPKKDKETVRKLAKSLFAEKKIDHDFDEVIKQWEKNRDLSSEYYFDIYRLRFHPDSHNGDRYLESLMEGKEPSLGYYILSMFMEAYPLNNLVITTNFDSLMEDALYLFSTKRPFVAGHESLARYISSDVQRPIIAKVHRSLFCEPFNSPQTTGSLSEEWRDALDYAFKTYVPVVIGYGGGDGSLMSFLEEETTRMRHGIYWCFVGEESNLDRRIQTLVEKKKGCFVKIDGFDQLMLEMGNSLFPERIRSEEIEKHWTKQTAERVNRYREQWNAIRKDPSSQTIIQQIDINEKAEEQKREESNKLSYWDYMSRADRARDAGDFQTSIDECSSAIRKRAQNALAYNNRGYAYAQLKKYKEAERDYNTAIEKDPGFVRAYVNRGDLYKEMKKYEEAEKDYNMALILDPYFLDAYNNRGHLYTLMERYEESEQDYDKAISLDPKYAIAYNNRGYLFSKMQKYEEAEHNYITAIMLDRKCSMAYRNLGDLYTELHRYEKAEWNYDTAIKLEPKNARAYNRRGMFYVQLGDYQKAEEDFNTAIKLDPQNVNVLCNRAALYKQLKKYDKAEKDLIAALEIAPQDACPNKLLGSIYHIQGKEEEAIEKLSIAIKKDPKDAESYLLRAAAYRAIGENKKAEEDEKKAAEIINS